MTATNQPRSAPGRPGFTLIELLMVILIIGILAGIVMGALHAAQQSGRADQTRGTISKIHQQLMLAWEQQRTRRVPAYPVGPELASPAGSRSFAARQLLARWDLLRAEFPDRYEDIYDVYAPLTYGGTADQPYIQQTIFASPLRQAYERAITRVTGTPMTLPPLSIRRENASAECLYLIATYGLQSETEFKIFAFEVGDTDGDGMREFIDGWGRPIQFLRWAPGYVPQYGLMRYGAVTDLQTAQGTYSNGIFRPARRDSFDPLGVSLPGAGGLAPPPPFPSGQAPPTFGYELVPLIYSAGLDAEYGLFVPPVPESGTAAEQLLRRRNPYSAYPDPSSGGNHLRGTPLGGRFNVSAVGSIEGGGHLDNITNHQLGAR
jgi:prepilin-type N-terminal cleavage/methylation domain-containing protein